MSEKRTYASGRSRQKAQRTAARLKGKAKTAEKKRKAKLKAKVRARNQSNPISYLDAKYQSHGTRGLWKYSPAHGKAMQIDEAGHFLWKTDAKRKAASERRQSERKKKSQSK